MQEATVTNKTQQNEKNSLTTDDLVLMIGEKEVNLFQTRKIINSLKDKINELTQQNQLQNEYIKRLQSDINNNVSDKTSENEELKDKIEKLKTELKEIQDNNTKLKTELKEIQDNNTKLKTEHNIVVKKLNKRITNLRLQLNKQEEDNEFDTYNKTLNGLTKEHDEDIEIIDEDENIEIKDGLI
jgi:chromosome segregation ATPase